MSTVIRTHSHASPWHVLFAMLLAPMIFAAESEPARLTLELRCEMSAAGTLAAIDMILRNDGGTDTAIVLGTARANGTLYLPETLSLDVGTVTHPEPRNFIYDDPLYPTLVGRIDPWIVSLPAQSAFSLRLGADDFYFDGYATGLHRETGVSSLRLRLAGRAVGSLNGDLSGLLLWKVHGRELGSPVLAAPADCGPD